MTNHWNDKYNERLRMALAVAKARITELEAHSAAMTAERDDLRRKNDALAELIGGEETSETKNYEIVDVAELQAQLVAVTAERDAAELRLYLPPDTPGVVPGLTWQQAYERVCEQLAELQKQLAGTVEPRHGHDKGDDEQADQ